MTWKGKGSMKKSLFAVFTAVFCFAALSVFSVTASARENVSVQIAPYYTEIDYMSVYNPAVEFPLITYKDITYFPMTYNLCARLGLATGFHESAGLYITRHDVPTDGSVTGLFGGEANNSYGTYYDAVIPEYPIYLNGIRIDNTKEEYPLINFRGITYFPMTWHFAVEELGFTTEWSAEKGFKLYRQNDIGSEVRFGKSEKDGVNIVISKHYPEAVEDANGNIIYHTRFWNERYKLLYDYGYAKPLEGGTEPKESDYREIRVAPECDKIFLEDGYLRYMSTRILDLTDMDATSQFSREHSFGGISFIHTIVEFGNAPAPYNRHSEYIFVRENGSIKRLEAWDEKNNLTSIFPDGYGGYYLCSDRYSPLNSSRWNTEFACVYRYTSDGEFYEVTVPDTNSLTGIGTYEGKLYVKAMYYAGNKSMAVNNPLPISTINSGYYEIDTRTGDIKKLYPYVPGNAFLSDDGVLYLASQPGSIPRIVDLSAGKLIALE